MSTAESQPQWLSDVRERGIAVSVADEQARETVQELAEQYGVSDLVETEVGHYAHEPNPWVPGAESDVIAATYAFRRGVGGLEHMFYRTAYELGRKTREELEDIYFR